MRGVNITELLSSPEPQKAMSAMVQSMREADKDIIRMEIIAQMIAEVGQRQAEHVEEISELRNREAAL